MLNRIRTQQFSARQTLGLLVVMALSVTFIAHAGGLDVPNRFVAGDTARADDVNENFDMLADRIGELEDQLFDLQSFISVSNDEINGLAGPHVIIEGANLHVRSGSGATDDAGSASGLGNLVIGYNEEAASQAIGDRDGGHNLVIGSEHKYTSTGGVVAGTENTITGLSAVVLGGTNNRATAEHAAVSGGAFNQATGQEASVSGGVSNFAAALRASASGGAQNTVSGIAGSISGGSGGACGGFAASISGGQSGIASGDQSSINGGQSNSAFGNKSTVSGGFNVTVSDDFDWRACDITCP